MDRNFISVFRSIPLWPNDLIPLDEILSRLLKVIGLDAETAAALGVTTVIGGILGFRDLKVHRFDGVTSVTGQIVIATELVLAPFQSYVGIVIGDPAGGTTSFPFSLRLRDEPPIKNNDEIFDFDPSALDPQLAAFQPVEKNPEAGFFDIDSWRVSLRNIPAKIRMLKGVTRVEPLDPTQPALGFRDLPNEHVDVGITLSLDFDANGNLELWPPDPTFTGEAGDPVGALDLDLGWFRVSDSPLHILAQGIGYHRPDTRFPDGFEPPTGLDDSWSGFMAQDLGGFWWKKPANAGEEEHVYAINFSDLLIGNDVFAMHGSFLHSGGPEDPFNSTLPVENADELSSRWSLRKIEVWVAEGAGDFLQIGGQVSVAAILGFFKNQPIKFDVSIGRILKAIEIETATGIETRTLPVVQLLGNLAPVQNFSQPTPDGAFRVPMFELLHVQLNRVNFELIFPGGTVEGVDIPIRATLKTDLGFEIGDEPEPGEQPVFEVELPGLTFIYPHPKGHLGDFRVELESVWFETRITTRPLDIFGYKLSVSRVGVGLEGGLSNRYFIACDAHILFPDSLGRAEVYGLRLTWDNDSDRPDPDIEGVGVAVKKPRFELVGVLKFLDGSPGFVPEGGEPITIQPGSLSGFVHLGFSAAKTPLTFEVGLMHGKYMVNATSAINSFWMVQAELIFPGGRPLGFADLAFYGLDIALGNNIQPRKAATTTWFDWYSKDLPKFNVISPVKWTAAHDRWAFGLGIIFGSQFHNGYAHNERLLGIYNSSGGQGGTFLFEGKIRFLKEVTKPGDPQIAILLVIAPDQILFRAEFHFSFPAEGGSAAGLVMTARGIIEVFSDRTGAGKHHVYLGRNQPLSERINAAVLLGFFTARSFFMLDWSDLPLSSVTLPPVAMAFGFAQGWSLDKKFGPLRFYLEANVEFEVGFTFASAVYGFLRVYGGVGLRLWGFGFGLSVDAAFTLFVSDGWELGGKLKVKLNLPWPIPDYKKTLEFHWGPGTNPPVVFRSPLQQLALASPSFEGEAPLHEWSEENALGVPANLIPERTLLPVDGAIVLAFRVPSGKRVPWISGVDAQPVDGSGEWQFRYTVEDVVLLRKPPSATTFEPVPDSLKNGFWEINSTAPATTSTTTTGGAPLSQVITIWGDTPGEQLRNLGSLERSGSITWLDGFLDLYSSWPCGPDVVMDPTCVHWDLTSFRLLDGLNTRVTLLENGKAIRSRPMFNPEDFAVEAGAFGVLDEVVLNPRPAAWDKHKHVLALPYIHIIANQEQGFIPFASGLEIDLPESTFVEITLISVFREELFTVHGLHGTDVVVSANASGLDLHVLTLTPPDSKRPITRVRIQSLSRLAGQRLNGAEASVLASVCYRTREQDELQQYIFDQRQSLDQILDVLDVPPGLPGQNGDHYHLHPQGTVYQVTPVVTCERKGPETGWEVVHDHLSLATATVTAGPPPTDLTPYFAATIPARDQDPVYLTDDMQLLFNRSYGPEMYTVSGFDFRVEVQDVQHQPVPIDVQWIFSEEPWLSPAQELLLEALLSSPCVTADITAVRKKLVLVLRPVLAPRTNYHLVIQSSAHPGVKLYDAPFTTSRYQSFNEQYGQLEGNHVDELLPGTTDETLLNSLLASLPAANREAEHAVFERIWEEALGLAFRERSERGELVVFYQLEDGAPGSPRVIMIDSPEPLLVDRRTTLQINAPGGAAIVAVRNFDGSRTLLFVREADAVVDLPLGDYVLTTTYLRAVAGLPTQRVAGDSSPSTLSITLSVSADAQIELEVL